jgi:hypothetical protein
VSHRRSERSARASHILRKAAVGDEWQDAGGKAGAPAALVQASKLADAGLQQEAVWAFGFLVSSHAENQSAAGAACAVALLMQLAQSSDAGLQKEAVAALGSLVNCHAENKSAALAAGALALLVQLAQSSDAGLQKEAVAALGSLVSCHAGNQSAAGAAGAVELMCSLLSTSPHAAVALAAVNTLYYLCGVEASSLQREQGGVAWCSGAADADEGLQGREIR